MNDAFSVQPGFTWYNFPRADTGNGFFKSTFEPSLALNYTLHGVRLTPTFYYDLALKGPTYELTASYAIPLRGAGTELDWTVTGGAYSIRDSVKGADPAVKNSGDYFLIGVSAPFVINSASKVVAGLAYTQGFGNTFEQAGFSKIENTAAAGRFVVTLSYVCTF